ncbi:hypothetical protein [Streptomyces adustus]|uniref:hypothetical protein n=1 Tax=Streptomyces adustus TaxID=1609272 RepID=UPI0037156E87
MSSAVTRLRLPPRRVIWLLLLPALVALPAAACAARPTPPAAGCACTPRPAATSADTLALSPGATLAAPQILPLASPVRGLRQRQDLAPTSRHQSGTGPAATAHPPASTPAPSSAPPAATSVFPPQSAAPPTASHEASAHPTPSPAAQPSPGPHSLPLYTALGTGALAAAALTAALAARRTRRTPTADSPTPVPAPAARAGSEGDLGRLHTALNALDHTARQEGAALPALRAARITPRTVDLLPDGTARTAPLAPFTAGAGEWWTLHADTALADEAAIFDEAPAPYPALVTLGHTPGGDLLLLNLARTPALLLEGRPAHITEVCTSLALELAISPWAGSVRIITVGFGEDLPQLLPSGQITHLPDAGHALRDLSEQLLEAHQAPGRPHPPYVVLCAPAVDTDTALEFARLMGKATALPVSLVAPAATTAAHFPRADILNASHDTPQHLHTTGTDIRLQRLTQTAYRQITSTLTTDSRSDSGLHAPAAEPRHTNQAEPESAPQQGQPTTQQPGRPTAHGTRPPSIPSPHTPASNGSGDNGVFPALLAACGRPATPRAAKPAGPTDPAGRRPASGTQVSGAPDAQQAPAAQATQAEVPLVRSAPTPRRSERLEGAGEERAAADRHAPEIRVLGPIEVSGVPGTGHGPRTAQLAALLYFRPGRSADALCTAMDPANPWSPATLNARVHGLRRALGNDPAGQPYLPRRTSGSAPYRLAPAVRCDWTRFLHLTEHTRPHDPAGLPLLEEALALVRGRPFGTQPPPWAEPHQQEMITRIIDTAHAVAAQRTPPGPHHNLTLARQAIATGLDIDEHAELLYRDWIRIEHAAGNRPGLHTAVTRIQHLTHTLNVPLQPETQQLIHQLLHTTGHERQPLP